MKVSARESDVVGTALRAVRNGAPLMVRWRFIAARSASAPYHLSHWVARRFQNVANVEVLPVSNWQMELDTGNNGNIPPARSPPSSATCSFSSPPSGSPRMHEAAGIWYNVVRR